MNRIPSPHLLAAVLLGSVGLAACSRDEPAPPPPPPPPVAAPASAPARSAPAAAAVSVTSVDLGTGVDAANRVVTPTTTFATGDAIHASVATSAVDPSVPQQGRLTARWTYEGDQLVDETSRDFNFTGTGNTAFTIENPDGWPTGNYQLEILYDGEVVQTRSFEVR